MVPRRTTVVAATATVALALATSSFYAALRWNLGVYFALAGYLLAIGTRLAVGKGLLEDRPQVERELLWASVGYLATAVSLVGGLLFSVMANLARGTAGEVDPLQYRWNHGVALLFLVIAVLGRWRLGVLRKALEARRPDVSGGLTGMVGPEHGGKP